MKYIYESRINNSFINEKIDKEILLIYWFGFALKVKKVDPSKNTYLEFHKKKDIHEIFNILMKESKNFNLKIKDKIEILKRLKSYYNSSYIILKFIEKNFLNHNLIDFGSGCGMINYVYKKNNFKIKSVYSCDIIEFCKLSFKKLNKYYDKYLFDDEIYIFNHQKTRFFV